MVRNYIERNVILSIVCILSLIKILILTALDKIVRFTQKTLEQLIQCLALNTGPRPHHLKEQGIKVRRKCDS